MDDATYIHVKSFSHNACIGDELIDRLKSLSAQSFSWSSECPILHAVCVCVIYAGVHTIGYADVFIRIEH
jgi:hypothetical protein